MALQTGGLRNISIQNYRTFKQFTFDNLAPVNLIVGKNNSGKTSLLEAIYLLVGKYYLPLAEFFPYRGEEDIWRGIRRRGYQITHLFYGHQIRPGQTIRVASRTDRSLSLELRLEHPSQPQLPLDEMDEDTDEAFNLELILSDGSGEPRRIPVSDDGIIDVRRFPSRRISDPLLTSSDVFLSTSPLEYRQLARMWKNIALRPKEEDVITALQILEPHVERLSFIGQSGNDIDIIIKLREQPEPVPLGSMGDGMRRILALITSAVTAEGATLLVDEIDTGLHYTAQTQMWRLLIETAKRLNVQVFATTHSGDCIQAFQQALQTIDDKEVGQLLRLERYGEDIRAVSYTSDELAIAVPERIEVR